MGSKLGKIIFAVVASLILGVAVTAPVAHAHRSGCHNLHTCPSDANTYACGDLGFACDGSTSIDQIPAAHIQVPLVVEKAFRDTFGRAPSVAESAFWKKRWRADKDGLRKLRSAMAWHKEHGSFGPKVSAAITRARLINDVNSIFGSVYDGRLPTPSESKYWISRTADKTTTDALRGAMAFHKAHGIPH
jgi:hypothetical protein